MKVYIGERREGGFIPLATIGRLRGLSRCVACGQLVGRSAHECASVDLKGDRHCNDCGKLLKTTGYERWKNSCPQCEKKRWRVKERRIRAGLKNKFGGQCQRCGYRRCAAALHFHHKDGRVEGRPGSTKSKEVLEHPERFELLCANCHIEHHHGGPK